MLEPFIRSLRPCRADWFMQHLHCMLQPLHLILLARAQDCTVPPALNKKIVSHLNTHRETERQRKEEGEERRKVEITLGGTIDEKVVPEQTQNSRPLKDVKREITE